MLLLPAAAHATVQVTQIGWDLPEGSDPAAALVIQGTQDDDEVTITFVPNVVGDPSDDELRITSASGPSALAAGPCTTDGTTITCEWDLVPDGILIVSGEAGSDSITMAGPAIPSSSIWIFGGAGNDTLIGGPSAERIYGDDGHGATNCAVEDCDDTIVDGLGRDRIFGGAGLDAVTYADRRVPVIVTLGAGKADDGQKGERDDVLADVENATGGRGNDRLVGSRVANVLQGGPGRDRIEGGAGNDTLRGGAGNDMLVGGPGNDRLFGDAGNDVLDARDKVKRDRGFRELVDGGAGRDTAMHDPKDRLVRVEVRRKALLVVKRAVRRA